MTNQVADKEHAVLGPSSWDRWSACPGSVVLEEQFPHVASKYAAEGSVAHEIAALCLTDNADAETYVGQTFECDGYSFEIDMEMADAVNDYIAQVHTCAAGGEILVEQEVPIGHLTGETGAIGTADIIAFVDGGRKMVVIDLKYGKGVQVWASSDDAINGQGGMYALGALEEYGAVYEDIEEIEIVIVQPRLDHVDSSTISVAELREFGEEVTLAAGRVALAQATREHIERGIENVNESIEDHLHPGEKQCKFCRAKSTCPALAAEVSGSMALVTTANAEEFEDLTLPKRAASLVIDEGVAVEKLAEAMRATPLIEEFIKGVRAEVERRLFAGEAVPGFKVVQGRKGDRAWADPETVEHELKKRLGAKDTYVKKVISVPEAEKAFKSRPRVWAKIAPLITQAEGKPSVAPESDPRPVYQVAAAIEDFADLTAVESEADAMLG